MKTERKKAILALSITLVIGIVLGVLGSALVHHTLLGKPAPPRNARGFIDRVLQVVEADSTQARALRPVLTSTAARLDSLQQNMDHNMGQTVEDLKAQVKPLLRTEQYDRLLNFLERARKQHERERGGPHGRGHYKGHRP